MKHLALALLIILAGSAIAQQPDKKMPNFKKSIDAPRVGKLHLEYVYDEDAEPVSTPASFKISIQCDGSRTPVLMDKVMGCELKSYKYEKENKKLLAEVIFPVMDAASIAHCERREEMEFDLGKFCADQLEQKLKAKAAKSKK